MSIRTFKATNLQAALADIREQMGPDASVLHTRQVRDGWLGWLGRTQVEVIAGLRGPGEFPASASSEQPAEQLAGQRPPDVRSFVSGAHTLSPAAIYDDGQAVPVDQNSDVEQLERRIRITDPDVDPLSVDPLVAPLRQAGVSEAVARRWLTSASSFAANLSGRTHDSLSSDERLEQLQRAIARELNLCGPIRTQPGERHVVALVGPTGVGKTTTVAKLAAGFRIEARRKVGLLTIDTYRIAAVQQLKAYAEIMDLPMQVVEKPEQMQPAMDQLGEVDLVLIDTAGRSPRSDARVDQLSEFMRAARPDETHLVLSATSSSENILTTLHGFAPIQATAVILTKLDETLHTAGVLSALTAGERYQSTPLSYITHGQQVPDDIAVADAPHLVTSLLPLASPSLAFGDAA